MSATNSTTHYELPVFLGSDKPAWLVDWNGAMASIDAAIYEAKQTADSAGTSASGIASDLATLSGTVTSQGETISTISSTLTTAVGNINTINSLIGNGTPTTTDQTIIGAINEINAHTSTIDSSITALQGKIKHKTVSATSSAQGTILSAEIGLTGSSVIIGVKAYQTSSGDSIVALPAYWNTGDSWHVNVKGDAMDALANTACTLDIYYIDVIS